MMMMMMMMIMMIITSCMGGRQYVPARCKLPVGGRPAVASLGPPTGSVLDLGPMYATDRQTSDAHHRLMPPPYGGGHNNNNNNNNFGRKPRNQLSLSEMPSHGTVL